MCKFFGYVKCVIFDMSLYFSCSFSSRALSTVMLRCAINTCNLQSRLNNLAFSTSQINQASQENLTTLTQYNHTVITVN